ncbi:TasA family protein [Halobacillus sp. Cin3]|uniref:TasA family protein n=1 Tax=Halobacillus sp. Cin3 TaxID=2928441 RepID=UPI00248DCDD7|nr:TasA family protein [Halobacillus sp. Cin3]
MKNPSLFLKIISIYSIFILLFVLFNPVGSTQALENQSRINISTSQDRMLNIKNFKPGDYAVRSFSLANEGTEAVQYAMTSYLKQGSEKFYEQLQFILEINGEQTYAGRLSDFQDVTLKSLDANHLDEMKVRIEFPYESGNEFQGLKSDVVFHFHAESFFPSPNNGEGSGLQEPFIDRWKEGFLPQTGENSPWAYYITGAILMITGTVYYMLSRKRRQNHEVMGAESS